MGGGVLAAIPAIRHTRAPVPPAVIGDAAQALFAERAALVVPHRRWESPGMDEHHRFSGTPIGTCELRSVGAFDIDCAAHLFTRGPRLRTPRIAGGGTQQAGSNAG